MGGKSGGDQVTGYQYCANLVVMIGNRIEELKAINFDKRGWILNDEQIADPRAKMRADATYNFTQPNIYGKDEGGIAGSLGLRIGNASPVPDSKYAEYLQSKGFPALSYPYLSYLVFKGRKPAPKFGLLNSSSPVSESGFYFGNNPFLKEMMLWVKRIHVRNDGRVQWYDLKSEIGLEWFEDKTEDINTKEHYLATAGNFVADFETNRRNSAGGKAYTISKNPASVMGGSFTVQGGEIYGVNADANWPIKSDGTTTVIFKPNYSNSFVFKIEILSVGKTKIKKIGGGDSYFLILNAWNINQSSYGYHTNGYLIECYIYPSESITLKFDTEFPDDQSWEQGHHATQIITRDPRVGIIHKGNNNTGTDINPIHKIREILTDDTAMNISESEINDEIFMRASDQIWDEGLGISCVFIEKNCKEALDEICAHIEAGVRVNRQTGKYEVILFRDNWKDSQNPLHFDKTNIKRGSFSVEVMNTDDAINVLNVNYYDRANIKNSSFNVYENGLIQTMGRENAETVDFPYFMNQRNAEVAANWKLKQLSTPAWKGSFATSARAARKLNRYDVFKITWPSKQIYDMPVRVMKINLGTATDTSVTIDFVEVVSYSNNLSSSIVVDAPVSGILPPQPANPIAFEVPYYALVQLLGQREVDTQLEYNPELGYLGVAAEKPQNNSLNALLYTDGGTGDYLQFQKVGVVDYSSGIYLDQQISQVDTSFTVIDLDYVQNGAPKFSGVAVGTIGQLNSELISFVSYDLATKILTVKRGVLDTVPVKHISGNIHFWGESFSYDSTEYSLGETVGAQVLTATPSGVDLLNPGSVKNVEMNARAIRPYPPTNVKINGEYWPEEIETDLILTWVDRNRTQQTGGEVLGWFDVGVTIEDGVEYIVELYDGDNVLVSSTNVGTANTATVDYSAVSTPTCKIKLHSVRNGYESAQSFEHEMILAFLPPYNLKGTWNKTTEAVDLTWDFD